MNTYVRLRYVSKRRQNKKCTGKINWSICFVEIRTSNVVSVILCHFVHFILSRIVDAVADDNDHDHDCHDVQIEVTAAQYNSRFCYDIHLCPSHSENVKVRPFTVHRPYHTLPSHNGCGLVCFQSLVFSTQFVCAPLFHTVPHNSPFQIALALDLFLYYFLFVGFCLFRWLTEWKIPSVRIPTLGRSTFVISHPRKYFYQLMVFTLRTIEFTLMRQQCYRNSGPSLPIE